MISEILAPYFLHFVVAFFPRRLFVACKDFHSIMMKSASLPPKQKSFARSLKSIGVTDKEMEKLVDEMAQTPEMEGMEEKYLFEISSETCNKVGGIYQVIRSKAGVTVEKWGNNFVMIGPYNEKSVNMEVDLCDNLPQPYGKVISNMREKGLKVITGHWLIDGYPQVILFDIGSGSSYLNAWRTELWEKSTISPPYGDIEVNDTIIFGGLVTWFLGEFIHLNQSSMSIAQFHEWLTAPGLIFTRTRKLKVATIFTTHATLLGRHLCAGNVDFYNNLQNFDLDKEAGDRNIYDRYSLERSAAHCAHTFTTVSSITGLEAKYLLKRSPDVLTPNGLTVAKFNAPHEFQNLHAKAKEQINDFVRGHFHGHYDFDLDRTLYFFIAGRYEFSNKGADLFIEALARLNYRLKTCDSDKTVVVFLIFPTKTNSFNVESLRGQAVAKQLKDTISRVQQNIGDRLYELALKGHLPSEKDELLTQNDRVALKRCILSSASETLPPICTHNVVDNDNDPVLSALRRVFLVNNRSDRVKVVFHPEFLSSTNPLFGMEYSDFVRGCHLGVFPSYYEPWGYTPAECTVMGIPSVTTNLSGFGNFMEEHIQRDSSDYGIYVVDRRFTSPEGSVNGLLNCLEHFVAQSRRERINQRNRTERLADMLDWKLLGVYYERARMDALKKTFPNHTFREWEGISVQTMKKPKSIASRCTRDTEDSSADSDSSQKLDDDEEVIAIRDIPKSPTETSFVGPMIKVEDATSVEANNNNDKCAQDLSEQASKALTIDSTTTSSMG